MRSLTLAVISAFAMSAANPPAPTCGPWVPQSDGTSWRKCVDQNNVTYCELKSSKGITRIDCP